MNAVETTPTTQEVSTSDRLSLLVGTARVNGLFRHSLPTGTLFYERKDGHPTWAEFYPLSSHGRSYMMTLSESGKVEKMRCVTRTEVALSGVGSQSRLPQQLASVDLTPGSDSWREVLSLVRKGF
jgi:hypothetical protein